MTNKKVIAIKDDLDEYPDWKFPFRPEDVERIRISIERGIIRWYLPKDLYTDMPDSMHFLYTNVVGMFLVISASKEDLLHLRRTLVDVRWDFERLVCPNTDGSVTVKKRYRGKKVGLLMKVRGRNLALRERMDSYKYTREHPVLPKIALNRYLLIDGNID